MPKLFKGRRIIHFVDNAPSLSNLVNGYANKPDTAKLVNMFHLALLALDCEWYGEWIPSKANIADVMTRPDRGLDELIAILGDDVVANSIEYTLVLPPMGACWNDLKEWFLSMRASAFTE